MTRRDPKYFLFFTASQRGRHAATAFLGRLAERTQHRDKPLSPRAFWRQLQAIKAWARQPAQDLTRFTMPVLITAGDHDRLVPPVHSEALARRIPPRAADRLPGRRPRRRIPVPRRVPCERAGVFGSVSGALRPLGAAATAIAHALAARHDR
ncbi:alpha/beta fold hydrolase [Xanthomonas campestris]|uniref:alpha/beta fold hydrolase n=1 Tax=Xanthomonas campestris TaxID=339 RepID=UPI00388D548C